MRKVAVEYVELCGLKNGDNQHNRESDNRIPLDDIAKQLGIGRSTLAELLMLERKLTPDVKELLDSGVISKTSASKIWVKLSENEQMELHYIMSLNESKTVGYMCCRGNIVFRYE